MSFRFLTTRRDGPVEYLTLNRPEVRNAFNEDVIAELTAWAAQTHAASLRCHVRGDRTLAPDGAQRAALRSGADGKAHRRAVVVGLVSEEEAQIVSGVREGEKVVVKGQDELPDGASVTIEEAEEPEPASSSARP